MTDHDLALLAAQAYDDPPDFTAGSMHGIVRDVGNTRVVAVAGTDEVTDWLRHNLRVGFRRWRLGLRCHSGFADAADMLIAGRIAHLRDSSLRVVVTGHSLGGAVAQLMGLYLVADACVTFGAPRLFDAESAWTAEGVPGGHNLKRYCHRNDPVPMIPPYHWGYRHVGKPRWWDGRGWQDRMSPLSTAWTALEGLMRFRGLVMGAIGDHDVRNYVEITKEAP